MFGDLIPWENPGILHFFGITTWSKKQTWSVLVKFWGMSSLSSNSRWKEPCTFFAIVSIRRAEEILKSAPSQFTEKRATVCIGLVQYDDGWNLIVTQSTMLLGGDKGSFCVPWRMKYYDLSKVSLLQSQEPCRASKLRLRRDERASRGSRWSLRNPRRYQTSARTQTKHLGFHPKYTE